MTKQDQQDSGTIKPMRIRVLWPVVKAAGLVPMTVTFAALFVVASAIVDYVEPGIDSLGDASWFLFAVITTVGFGDYTCATFVGRIVTVALSLYSVFYLALVTGAIVNYCSERMRLRSNESVAAFIDQLERLPELSHDELVQLSNRIKKM